MNDSSFAVIVAVAVVQLLWFAPCRRDYVIAVAMKYGAMMGILKNHNEILVKKIIEWHIEAGRFGTAERVRMINGL